MRHSHLLTPHGSLNFATVGYPPSTSPSSNTLIVLIHGNSSSSRIFHPLVSPPSPLTTTHRTLLFDLPGHGSSSDAPDPART
ncbi:hypothetical protein K402DRAFT_425925, partial [Aulographum hederae CBS 113979]